MESSDHEYDGYSEEEDQYVYEDDGDLYDDEPPSPKPKAGPRKEKELSPEDVLVIPYDSYVLKPSSDIQPLMHRLAKEVSQPTPNPHHRLLPTPS